MRLIVNAIKCKICGDIIESKSRYDFVSCSCWRCSVDGGLDYARRCGNREHRIELGEWEAGDDD